MANSGDLGKQFEKTVEKLVSTGRYNSRDDVLREGVRLVDEHEKRFAELNAKLEEGLADVRAGRTRPAEEVFAELKAKFQKMAADQTK
jgi:antitoxin ParD1/3/4